MDVILKDYVSKSTAIPKIIKVKKNGIIPGSYSDYYEILDIIDVLKKGNYDETNQMVEQIGKEIIPVKKNRINDGINYSVADEHKWTTMFSRQQFGEIKEKVIQYENYMDKHGIDKNNKIDVLFAIYALLQKDIKYYNPNVMLGSWHSRYPDNPVGVSSAYGALVKKYAMCGGISNAFKLMCNYFNIECECVSAPYIASPDNVIGHGINKVILSNGQVSYIDLSSEIGMVQDGLHNSDRTLRNTPLEKKDVTTTFFLLTKEQYFNKCHHTISENNSGVCMDEIEKERRMNVIEKKLYHTIPMKRVEQDGLNGNHERRIHIESKHDER